MREYGEEDYAQQLRALLPRGLAWTFSHDGVFMRLLRGLSAVMSRIAARGLLIITKEQIPGTTEEMFEEWEKELGLPEECRPERQTFEQRRYDILYKYNLVGGQSRGYFIGIGKLLGLNLTIEEFKPFRVGENTCGEPIQGEEWYFVWRVLWLSTRIAVFRVGIDTAGTPLRSWVTNYALECILNRLKPAHTHVIVAYVDPENPDEDTILLKR